ncbi:DnaA N-terminal domain-containing protein [Dongia deserti]|uniref:DnaA N-terminal domain-containing protein n=1 Tax=Dongia deserti TaxID=2268030 RepID=UPI000E6538DA|nr:DnaA N-terminal domain-containing protein [Dongia deserti]
MTDTAAVQFEQPHALGPAGDRLRERIGDVMFRAWFRDAWIESNTGATVRVAIAGRFARDWIANHYGDALLDCFRRESPSCERVEIVVRPARATA